MPRIVTPRLLLAVLPLCALTCAKEDYARLYTTSALPPDWTQAQVTALDHLGATLLPGGVNFSVWSQHATRMEVLLFDDPESPRPSREFAMTRMGDVWNLYVQGVGLGQSYGYVAWGPNWVYDPAWRPGTIHGFVADVDADGNRFNPNKLLFDPYTRALHRDFDWSKGSLATGPSRTDSTWAAAAKSVVVKSEYVWSDNETGWRRARESGTQAGHGWNESIVYEVHPKGFTASPASGVAHPGTYRGLGEKADYFQDLGVTAVELMPVMEKPLDGGYWGYQTLAFFAPELTYAADRRPGKPLDEFKYMVDELHQRGVEVWLDVVYNHTGEGGLWREKIALDNSPDPGDLANFEPKEVAGLYAYRGLDNSAYYALSLDNQTYWNNTGVGDETRCNNAPMKRLILDSLRFWATEMHVDGFRFDLAPILAAQDGNPNSFDAKNTITQTIADDPILQRYNTRLVAEPWSMYGAFIGGFPASSTKAGYGWGEWNGHFRDFWRAFFNNDAWNLSSKEGVDDGGSLLTGAYDVFNPSQRKPYHSVNFVTVHDGYPLYDVFSFNDCVGGADCGPRNGCGPLNPVCCDTPNSPFCTRNDGEHNNRSRNWGTGAEDLKRQLMRNLFVVTLVSHGTPMLLGGDEWMRTQLGNNNAYSTRADNSFNWFDWGSWQANDEKGRMHDFVKKLLQFRKDHLYAFAPLDYGAGAPYAWKSAANTTAVNWGGKSLAMHYTGGGKSPQLLILINGETSTVTFTLPPGVAWERALDTQASFDTAAWVDQAGRSPRESQNIWPTGRTPITGSYGVPSRAVVILEEAQ